MDALTLIRELADAYATCRNYEDHGIVLIGGAPSGRFQTRFDRATGKLQFTFVDEHAELELAIEGGRIRSFAVPESFGAPLRAPGTLKAAIATLAGITHSAGQVVPRLLWPADVGGRSLVDVARPSLVAHGLIGDEKCAWVRLGDEFTDSFIAIAETSRSLRRYVIAGGSVDSTWFPAARDMQFPSRLPARMIEYDCRMEFS